MASSYFEFRPPVRSDGTVADAGVPTHNYEPGRGKRANLIDEEAGRLFGKTSVSAAAPDFFKGPMHSNLEYFENRGQVEHLHLDRGDPSNNRERAAGFHSVEESRRAANFVGSRNHDVKASTDRVYSPTACSPESPQWFKCAFDDNRQYLESHGTSNPLWFNNNSTKSVHALKQKKKFCSETHMTSSHACSPTSPDWMKSPLEANREYFKETGVHVPERTGPTEDLYNEFPVGRKSLFNVNPNTGKTSNIKVCSATSPRWMRSPVLNNKAYFEKVGNCKLQETVKTERENLVKRLHTYCPDTGDLVFCRAHMVSADKAPEWMTLSDPRHKKRSSSESTPSPNKTQFSRSPSSPSEQRSDRRSSGGQSGDRQSSGQQQRGKQTSGEQRSDRPRSGGQRAQGRERQERSGNALDRRCGADSQRTQGQRRGSDRPRGQRQ